MATTYYSTDCASGSGVQAKALHAGLMAVRGSVDLSTLGAALAANDVIQMVKVPNGAIIHDVILDCPDIDSGTTITLDVGDGDSTARYINASTVGQAGGIARLAVAGGTGKTYAADDTIDIKVSAGPATAQTGTIYLTVLYSMDA